MVIAKCIPGRWLLGAVLLLGGCHDTSVEPAMRTAALEAGSTLSAYEWTPADAPAGTVVEVAALVRDADGVPIADVPVKWRVRLGGGSVPTGSTRTDVGGIARQQWTLGPPGFQRLVALLGDLPAVRYEANGTVEGANVVVESGDDQVRGLDGRFAPFVLRATNPDGTPLAGAAVSWLVTTGTASLRRASTVTDADGRASVRAIGSAAVQQIIVLGRVAGAGTATFHARVTAGEEIVFDTVATGLLRPTYAIAPPGDARLFIVEQAGRVRILENGALRSEAFLDIRAKVSATALSGMFSIAFHPQYASNGYVFVYYIDLAGSSRIERYTATPGGNLANPASAKLILSIPQPIGGHYGGQLLFGPDGKLFIPLGDGGGHNDPDRVGQDLSTLLGKVLRINVDVADSRAYVSPNSNPFIGNAAARPEIWALGVRNPWRFAFDKGLMYLADVGEAQREEVNIQPANAGGINYGWRIMEGSICRGVSPCDQTGLTLPAFDYDHTQGCSITGGFVYRGSDLPEIDGTYFYSDFCAGWIRSFRYVNGAVTEQREWTQLGTLSQPTSFGLDGRGELYITTVEGILVKFIRRP